ncbi:MAG: ribosomal protein S18-alanine N-acetyltransferase [Nitrospirae bacterium]|nr:ribosomal protein S18-alanine N-acetyltransferase [Nitrospirota bacterium]
MAAKALKSLILESMSATDLAAIVGIEQSSFTMPWSETLFNNEIHNPRSNAKVAKMDGEVVGYICASQIIDEGHILNLAVHPDFRRLGIASALVGNMIDHLREEGCRVIFLEVRISNEEAKRMYEGFHFRVIGIRKEYYVSPVEDAVIMSLKLEG